MRAWKWTRSGRWRGCGGEFGYAAKPGSKLALMDAVVRRGFRGELHHVRHGSELIRIRSGETGVDLREEA